MKRVLLYVLILIAVLLIPVERTDVGKLQPIQTIAISREGDSYIICTDTGDIGRGVFLEDAFRNLKETTPAVVYLDTADFLLLSDMSGLQIDLLKEILKGNISLYQFTGDPDLQEVSKFLTIHGNGPTLKSWEKGVVLPVLVVKNNRMILSEKT